MMKRVSWDEYFFDVSNTVASRATCPRLHVGAVAVSRNRIVATGYNGSLPGEDHCYDHGCKMVNGHCDRTIHAESNLVAQLALLPGTFDDLTVYVTHTPCGACMKLLRACGVKKIKWDKNYPNTGDTMPVFNE